jgi:hypothetical protein
MRLFRAPEMRRIALRAGRARRFCLQLLWKVVMTERILTIQNDGAGGTGDRKASGFPRIRDETAAGLGRRGRTLALIHGRSSPHPLDIFLEIRILLCLKSAEIFVGQFPLSISDTSLKIPSRLSKRSASR